MNRACKSGAPRRKFAVGGIAKVRHGQSTASGKQLGKKNMNGLKASVYY